MPKNKKQPKASLHDRTVGLISAVHGLEHDNEITSDRIEIWRKEFGNDSFKSLEKALNLGGNHGIAQALHWVHNNPDWELPHDDPTPKPTPKPSRGDGLFASPPNDPLLTVFLNDDIDAITHGDYKAMDPATTTIDGVPLMMIALAANALKICQWLYDQGFEPNVKYQFDYGDRQMLIPATWFVNNTESALWAYEHESIEIEPILNVQVYDFVRKDLRDDVTIQHWKNYADETYAFRQVMEEDHPEFWDMPVIDRMRFFLNWKETTTRALE